MQSEPESNGTISVLTGRLRTLTFMASRLNRVLAIAAGSVIGGIAMLIVVNVLLRYFTGKAILGAEEIIQVAMVPVIFLAIGYCGQIGGHVSVDILEPVLPQGFWRIVDPVIKIMGATAFAALAWQALQSASLAGEFNETTNIRRIPHQPMWIMLAVGAAFAGIVELVKLRVLSDSPLVITEESE